MIAFAALDTTRARSEFEAVQAALPVADTATSGQRALAEAWSDIVADQPAPVRSSSLLPPIDDRSNVATELRLLQAVAALRRGDVVAASDLRAEIEHSGALATLAYWHAPVRLFDAHRAAHALDQTTADADRAGAIAILATQKRRHFDPIARQWVGAPSPAAEQIAARIHALAKRIGAAREQPF